MTWNYRLVRHEREADGRIEEWYAVHEVYYDEKGEPEHMGEPTTFVGDTRIEVIDALIKASRDVQALNVFVPPEKWKEKGDG